MKLAIRNEPVGLSMLVNASIAINVSVCLIEPDQVILLCHATISLIVTEL